MAEMQTELAEQKLQLQQHQQEIQRIKEYMRAMRVSNPRVQQLQSEMENDEVIRYVVWWFVLESKFKMSTIKCECWHLL